MFRQTELLKSCTQTYDTQENMGARIFFFSCSSLSQFIELSHPQLEAFNLDSGVTQPQLSFTAAAVIIPTLKSNGNLMERKAFHTRPMRLIFLNDKFLPFSLSYVT